MTDEEAVQQYMAEARLEREKVRAEGMAYFGRSPAWEKFIQQMVDEINPGKLIDDFDD